MTENEAQITACCGPEGVGFFNDVPRPARWRVASQCMAWRWSETKRTAAFLEAVQAKMQSQDKPNFNTATQAVYAETGGKFERVEGFCGIAGQPS